MNLGFDHSYPPREDQERPSHTIRSANTAEPVITHVIDQVVARILDRCSVPVDLAIRRVGKMQTPVVPVQSPDKA